MLSLLGVLLTTLAAIVHLEQLHDRSPVLGTTAPNPASDGTLALSASVRNDDR
jgi:hypothetical protein